MTLGRPSHAASTKDLPPFPPYAERVAAVRTLMGTPDAGVRRLADGIRSVARRHFDAHVVPLVEEHWPAVFSLPFGEKLRIGACDLYASAPYTAFLCSPESPLVLRVVTGIACRVPLPTPALSLLGRASIEAFGRFACAPEQRRIVLVAAFIVVADHVLDHVLTEPPEERGRRLDAVIDGREAADSPELSLTRALAVAMAERLGPEDRPVFEAAMARVKAWIRAEVHGMTGMRDPTGLGHRIAGVEGTIDGLLFPVARFAGGGVRKWMYDVSLFVQAMDDWFDCDSDAVSNRTTPVLTGRWTFSDVEAAWHRTVSGIETLLQTSGLGSPRYVHFVREAYVLMMIEVMEAMAARPGD